MDVVGFFRQHMRESDLLPKSTIDAVLATLHDEPKNLLKTLFRTCKNNHSDEWAAFTSEFKRVLVMAVNELGAESVTAALGNLSI